MLKKYLVRGGGGGREMVRDWQNHYFYVVKIAIQV